MPLYSFRNKETNEEWTELMSMDERENFLIQNQHIEQLLTSMNIIRGVGGIKNDGGWKENLQRISNAHPTSELASSMGSSMTTKDVKTLKAVEKWRQKRRMSNGGV